MADSNIVVSALEATPTLRGVKLAWAVDDPHANGLLNLALDKVEVWGGTTNNRNAASLLVEGVVDALYAGAVEEQTYYFWIRARNNYVGDAGERYYGDWYPVSESAGVSAVAIGMSGLAFGLANGKLTVTHNSPSSNQLTIAVKTQAGDDPSPSDPVYIALPSIVAGIGAYVVRSVSSALSLTLSSGSTLGISSGIPCRVWFILFDDNGTLRLGAVCLSNGGGFVYPLPVAGAMSSTAEGGAGGADTLSLAYTAVAVSSKPFRILGFADWNQGLSVAGQWASAPSSVSLFGPGTPKPGDTVQDASQSTSPSGGGTTTVPLDNTTPQQSTEGNGTSFSVQLTPTSPINLFEFDLLFHLSASGATPVIGAMYRDSDANAIATCWGYIGAADETQQLSFKHRVQAGDAAQRIYNFKVGPSNAVTLRAGTLSGGAMLNGTLKNFHGIKEIMA